MSTASLQKDLARGHVSEIDGQLFKLVDLAHSLGIPTPTYNLLIERFKNLKK